MAWGSVECVSWWGDVLYNAASLPIPPHFDCKDDPFPPLLKFEMVVGDLTGNAGYQDPVGSLTPNTVEINSVMYNIASLFSFGANWCRMDLQPPPADVNGIPEISFFTVNIDALSGQIDAGAGGYSYGGLVNGIQAYLVSKIGQTVQVKLTPNYI